MAKLNMLVIHCTATMPGHEVTSDMLRHWHTDPVPRGRGWKQVGYADMIHLDGTCENLVSYDEDDLVEPNEITNGAAGYNASSRHVVYVGGLNANGTASDTRTPQQMEALSSYVVRFLVKHPTCTVGGHNQLANKACPSFDVVIWMRGLFFPHNNICTIFTTLRRAIDEAKLLSLESGDPIEIIRSFSTELFYVDKPSMIRTHEALICTFEKGVITSRNWSLYTNYAGK